MNRVQNGIAARSKATLLALCVLVWGAILVATLWPFNPLPRNDLSWIGTANGIHFGEKGVAVSSAPFHPAPAATPGALTIEVWLRIQNEFKVNTILSFYGNGNGGNLRLRQYNDSLIIAHIPAGRPLRAQTGKMDVDHLFHTDRPTLLTIASSRNGTNVYADGVLRQTSATFTLSERDFAGNLVLGTSPVDYEPWSGDVLGLAFYQQELNAAVIEEHYREWLAEKAVPVLPQETPIAIFPFAERTGGLIHNAVATEPGLRIPNHFYLPQKPMLRTPWREYTGDWNYVADIFRNVVGFIPLGMIFYLYLRWGWGSPRAGLLTILLGAATSLTIEILQAFIPMRYSGMTDILTNSLGTALGVLLLETKPAQLAVAKIGWKRNTG